MFKFNEKLMCSSAFAPNDYCYHQTQNESGRSMVEMLGVLAVIGVLSVAGVAGFKTAMNKHRANELLSEASQRAVVIAAQKAMGRSGESLSLAEFGDNSWSVSDEGLEKQFVISTPPVDEEVCKQIVQLIGGGSQIIDIISSDVSIKGSPTSCTTGALDFVFNDDLSIGSTDESSSGCPAGSSTTGTGGSTGVSYKSNLCKCGEGKIYTSDGCVAEELLSGQCNDHTQNQCGIGFYCNWEDAGNYSGWGDGICTPVGSGENIGKYLRGHRYLTYKSAYSWCIGNGKHLVSQMPTPAKSYDLYTGNGYYISVWTDLGAVTMDMQDNTFYDQVYTSDESDSFSPLCE